MPKQFQAKGTGLKWDCTAWTIVIATPLSCLEPGREGSKAWVQPKSEDFSIWFMSYAFPVAWSMNRSFKRLLAMEKTGLPLVKRDHLPMQSDQCSCWMEASGCSATIVEKLTSDCSETTHLIGLDCWTTLHWSFSSSHLVVQQTTAVFECKP